ALVELPADLRWRALLVLPAVGRATPPLLARCFASARVEGQGATFRDGLSAGAAPLGLALAVALAVAALGVVGLALAALSVTAEQIQEREPAAFADWMARVGEFPFPGGESVADLLARAWPAFEAIVAAHEGEALAVVAHGGTNRALLCAALGLPLARLLALGQDYGALSVLARIGARWELRRLNEHAVL